MKNIRKILFSLMIMICCMFGVKYNVLAEDVANNNGQTVINYDFTSGKNQKYVIGESEELKFEINAKYVLIDKLYINGNLLDSTNYTVSGENAILVLKKDYLDTLNNGIHTLKVTLKNGKSIETRFIIEKTVTNPSTGIGAKSGIIMLVLVFGGLYILVRKQSKFPKHN